LAPFFDFPFWRIPIVELPDPIAVPLPPQTDEEQLFLLVPLAELPPIGPVFYDPLTRRGKLFYRILLDSLDPHWDEELISSITLALAIDDPSPHYPRAELRDSLLPDGVPKSAWRPLYDRVCLADGGIYGDHRDEYVRRLLHAHDRPAKAFDIKPCKIQSLGIHVLDEHLSNPLHPVPFVLASRSVALLQEEVQQAYRNLVKATTDAGRAALNDDIDELLGNLQHQLDIAFTEYVRGLQAEPRVQISAPITCWMESNEDDWAPDLSSWGVTDVGLLRFTKKAADSALKGALGISGQPGDGIFRMDVGLSMPITIAMDSPANCGAAFGIYMARKGFVVNDPRKADKATEAMFERVMNPAPPLSPQDSALRDKMKTVGRAIARHLCRDYGDPLRNARMPNSGKSCLESPQGFGGKRNSLFDTGVVTMIPDWGPYAGQKVTPVVPCTILSGGKLRTISTTSVITELDAFWNEHLFTRIRTCAWSVAGRSVADWVSTLSPPQQGDMWVSGDLAAATDMLDGFLADAFVDEMADSGCYGSDKEEARTRMQRSLFKAELWERYFVDGRPAYRYKGSQKRGQLMASDFSFPILCVMGFLIGIKTFGLLDKFHRWAVAALRGGRNARTKFWKRVQAVDKFGVNGDDFVARGRKGTDLKWLHAVAITGGVPEPAKSPYCPWAFTINSELWLADHFTGCFRPACTVLPSMFLGLHSAGHKAADEKWVEILRHPAASPGSSLWRALAIDLCLLPDVSRSSGGLGLRPPARNSKLAAARAMWARDSSSHVVKPSDLLSAQFKVARSSSFSLNLGKLESVMATVAGSDDRLPVGLPKYGWFDKSSTLQLAASRFNLRKITRWTTNVGKPLSYRAVLDSVREKVKDDHRAIHHQEKRCYELEQQGLRFAIIQEFDDVVLPDPVSTFIPDQIIRYEAKQRIELIDASRVLKSGIGFGNRPRIPQSSEQAAGPGSAALDHAWRLHYLRVMPTFDPSPAIVLPQFFSARTDLDLGITVDHEPEVKPLDPNTTWYR
jgi:hypothetical protein